MGIWRRFVSFLGESRPSLPSLDALSLSAQDSLQYRQGDLLFVSRPGIPAGVVTWGQRPGRLPPD